MLSNIHTIYIKPGTAFSEFIREWAKENDLITEEYDMRVQEHIADGFLLINENQDTSRELDELFAQFDRRHIPVRKVDINGTLQVAVNGTNLWMKTNKCEKLLIIGADSLLNNKNLNRFFSRIVDPTAKAF